LLSTKYGANIIVSIYNYKRFQIVQNGTLAVHVMSGWIEIIGGYHCRPCVESIGVFRPTIGPLGPCPLEL